MIFRLNTDKSCSFLTCSPSMKHYLTLVCHNVILMHGQTIQCTIPTWWRLTLGFWGCTILAIVSKALAAESAVSSDVVWPFGVPPPALSSFCIDSPLFLPIVASVVTTLARVLKSAKQLWYEPTWTSFIIAVIYFDGAKSDVVFRQV